MDWSRFLEENNIPFVTRSQNTKRGEVSVQCPMCGVEDPSMHLGINLQNDKWGCHRDSSHRGISPHVLVRALLNCSTKLSKLIVKQYSHSDPDSLESALAILNPETEAPEVEVRRDFEGEFKGFGEIRPRGASKRFFNYLMSRGYNNPQNIIKNYNLKCAYAGPYKDRIIVPVRHCGELIGWTSRALGAPISAPRYLASSEDVKTTVFDYDYVKKGGNRLFVVEGPFDAIRLDSHGHDGRCFQVRATCTFGTSATISQIAILRALVKSYDEAYVLFDKGADGPASNLAQWIGAKIAHLPDRVDDPADLKPRHLDDAFERDFNGAWDYLFGFRGNVLIKNIPRQP
jgi:hypothetical protein